MQEQKYLDCDSTTSLMSSETKIIMEIAVAAEAENDNFVAIFRGCLAFVRTQLDALFNVS